jgi:hypothetical protein
LLRKRFSSSLVQRHSRNSCFAGFQRIDGDIAPSSIDDLIQHLLASETEQIPDAESSLRETATFVIEQSIEK